MSVWLKIDDNRLIFSVLCFRKVTQKLIKNAFFDLLYFENKVLQKQPKTLILNNLWG
jgi:hypothetical protein